ncbi:MAG: hypothetical protein FWG57_00435 [Endomicrobia bacterium]|nr:hypothetical protein [Endomicrobiia bacterium]
MKKLTLAVCGMFVLTSLSFGGPGMDMKEKAEHKEEREARKARMEAAKRDHMEYQKNLDALIEKYNAADSKGREEIKKEIRALVAIQTDKEIALKKDMLEKQKERIQKLETSIAKLEANKDKRIDKKVELFISPEGQQKMQEKREKMENKKAEKGNNEKDKKAPKKSK